MKYFKNSPYTAEELKDEYRILCKKLHPDIGGNADAFKEMMHEYEIEKQLIVYKHQYSNKSTESKKKSQKKSKHESSEESRYSIIFNSLLKDNNYKMNQNLEDFVPIAKKLAKIPFNDILARYDKISGFIMISMRFDKIIEELEISKYPNYNELSFTIWYESEIYRSTNTVDVIVDKILNVINKNETHQKKYST